MNTNRPADAIDCSAAGEAPSADAVESRRSADAAYVLDVSGDVWENAAKRYRNTSWLSPLKKWRRYCDARCREIAFEIAIEMYEDILQKRHR